MWEYFQNPISKSYKPISITLIYRLFTSGFGGSVLLIFFAFCFVLCLCVLYVFSSWTSCFIYCSCGKSIKLFLHGKSSLITRTTLRIKEVFFTQKLNQIIKTIIFVMFYKLSIGVVVTPD